MEKYNMEMETALDTIPGKIMNRIQKNSVVLEFGCAYGRMTKYMKEALQCQVYIAELDTEAYEHARQFAVDGYRGDIETGEWYPRFANCKFVYILFEDVLEHLRDPYHVLKMATTLLKESGEIIVSIPNIGHNDILVKLYQNHFNYTSIGLLDETHVHFWGAKDLEVFAQKIGCKLRVVDGICQLIYHTEQHPLCDEIPNSLKDVLACREYNDVYQFLLVLQKKEWVDKHNFTTEWLLQETYSQLAVYVYWNMGEGYTSKLVSRIIPQRLQDNKFRFYCDTIPNGCKHVRFDPPLGYLCVLSDVHIITNIGSCEPRPLNGVSINGTIVFSNTNPQIEFDLPIGAQWFDISARLQIHSGHELSELFTAIQSVPIHEQRNLALQEQVSALTAQQAELTHDRQALQGQVSALTAQHAELTHDRQALQEQVFALTAQQAELTHDRQALQEQVSSLTAQHAELTHDRQALQVQVSALTAQQAEQQRLQEQVSALTAQQADLVGEWQLLREQVSMFNAQAEQFQNTLQEKDLCLGNLKQELTQLQDMYEKLTRHAAHVQAQNVALQAQYQCIADSQCWKLTKPLRVFLDVVKKTTLGMLLHKTARSLRTSGLSQTIRKIQGYHFTKPALSGTCSTPQTIAEMAEKIIVMGGTVFNQERLSATDIVLKKKCLLISHEMNLTGAPVALGYLAKAIEDMGHFPVLISPHDGRLCEQLSEENFPIFIYAELFQTDFVSKCAGLFDYVVVCTNVGAPIIAQLNGSQTPVLWWIHEARVSYHPDAVAAMPESLEDNIHVYCGGSYAERILREFRPNYQVKQLLYYVPDYANSLPTAPTFHLEGAEGKTVFAIIGMQEERKGQDILVSAIRMLSPEQRNQCLFVFVGKSYFEPIWNDVQAIKQEFPENIQYIAEVGREDLTSLYMQIDCLVCASRDDPMPIVVTEAMLMSKIIICSENTGSADLLAQMNAGIVYRQNDPAALAQCIEYVHINRETAAFTALRERARQAYERFFSQAVFQEYTSSIIRKLCNRSGAHLRSFEGKVSVVIPSYNAGDSIKDLLLALQSQEKIGTIEIVVVDSESKDGTADRAEALGAKVIRIKQSDFSHSYARNLGAEHASGDYLLFMTQDAMPNGSLWICGLMQPVMTDGVVAVSCQESPRPDCDLLGRVSIWLHSEYMGILDIDKIMKLPARQDYDNLRRHGQLNDVTCLVKRDLFMAFRYQGDYAEDLDLGIRLIRAGHTIALLSSVKVIHSHTRPAFYHMKRSLVDLKTLKKILPDMPVESMDAQCVANRIITAYCATTLLIVHALEREYMGSWESFCSWAEQDFTNIKAMLPLKDNEELLSIIQTDYVYQDQNVRAFVEELFQAYGTQFQLDMGCAESGFYFLTRVLTRYWNAHGTQFSPKLFDEVLELLPKYVGQLFGLSMASYAISYPEENGVLSHMITKYSEGV